MLRSILIKKKLDLKFVSNSNEQVYHVEVIYRAFVYGFIIEILIFRLNVLYGRQCIHLDIVIALL